MNTPTEPHGKPVGGVSPIAALFATLPPATALCGHADAALVALCARLVQAEMDMAEVLRHAPDTEDGDAMADPFHEEQAAIAEQLLGTRATTLTGVKARAVAYAAFVDGNPVSNPRALVASPYTSDRLLGGLLLDLLALA